MLVLSRKVGETIRIGDNTSVTVVRIDGGRVVLGFEAPAKVRIMRDELNGPTNAPPVPQAAPIEAPLNLADHAAFSGSGI